MRISVVTPSFNMAPYLQETISSVLSNLREGDEYFIIDGGSTDGSVDIIRRYERQISGWVSEADHGYADAIGKGFDRATGDILCWINAGDVYLTGAFDAARKLVVDDVDMIFGDDFYMDEASRVISYSHGWVPDLRMATLFGTWSPLQDACFWRRGLYQKIGGIDRSLRFAADYDLFLRMALAGQARYVPMTFSAFRRHQGQKSMSGASPYKEEKMICRRRELAKLRGSWPADGLNRLTGRVAMSVRARLAPIVWRREDLAGRQIQTLAADRYWPKKRSQ
jgi:glycosyltransferase involved in cell wall biosynthesis